MARIKNLKNQTITNSSAPIRKHYKLPTMANRANSCQATPEFDLLDFRNVEIEKLPLSRDTNFCQFD